MITICSPSRHPNPNPNIVYGVYRWSSVDCESTHRHVADLWSHKDKEKLLKTRVMRKKNRWGQEHVFGLPYYCTISANATSVIFKQLKEYFNPAWGLGAVPTVVMASSIVFGGNVASLLQYVHERAAPSTADDDVFSHALATFGFEGPRTCHPFAHEYDIIQAVFVGVISHRTADHTLGLQQATFTVTDPSCPNVSTAATLSNIKQLPSNLKPGDVLRLEVVNSSPRHAELQVSSVKHTHTHTHTATHTIICLYI